MAILYRLSIAVKFHLIDEADRYGAPVRVEKTAVFEEHGRDVRELAEEKVLALTEWLDANLPKPKPGEGGRILTMPGTKEEES